MDDNEMRLSLKIILVVANEESIDQPVAVPDIRHLWRNHVCQ